jgi:hypothetical protein
MRLSDGREVDWRRWDEMDKAERRKLSAQMTVEERILGAMELSRLALERKQAVAQEDD